MKQHSSMGRCFCNLLQSPQWGNHPKKALWVFSTEKGRKEKRKSGLLWMYIHRLMCVCVVQYHFNATEWLQCYSSIGWCCWLMEIYFVLLSQKQTQIWILPGYIGDNHIYNQKRIWFPVQKALNLYLTTKQLLQFRGIKREGKKWSYEK